jgi:hypothetical protein
MFGMDKDKSEFTFRGFVFTPQAGIFADADRIRAAADGATSLGEFLTISACGRQVHVTRSYAARSPSSGFRSHRETV